MNLKAQANHTEQFILDVSKADWRKEMKKGAEYYHNIGVWVAIIFNPIFGLTDYINIPESWTQVFILRCGVSAITFIGLLLYKRKLITTYLLVAIPFALISMQNAYTYSLIGSEDILGHNLNYLALFLGASLFLLWPVFYSIIAIVISFVATIFFVSQNLNLTLQDFLVEGGVLLATGSLFTIFMIQARFRLRLKEVKTRLALTDALKITAEQKDELLKTTRQLQEAKSKIENMNSKLIGYNDQLEDDVRQRTAKLTKANREMDQLVYSLSHDFRTPLVNVQGLIELSNDVDDASLLHSFISKMGISVNRFDELLRDMMNYAVYWDEEIKKVDIDLKNLILNLWEHFAYIHKGKQQLIFTEQSSQIGTIYTDYEKLRVIFYGILSNAAIYNSAHGDVEISMVKTNQGITIHFADMGEGIAEKDLPKIFDMFYRGSAKSQGAGMGLYIAKGIVEQLNGTISIHSTKAVGTTVTLNLPLT